MTRRLSVSFLGTLHRVGSLTTEILVWGNVTSVHLHLCPFLWPLLYFRPRNCQRGCVLAAVVNLRLAGFLNQPLTATTNRKTLLCHQPKVSLKEQFSWTSDWLLTQRLAAKFSVAGGNLGLVSSGRTELEVEPHWPYCSRAEAPFS